MTFFSPQKKESSAAIIFLSSGKIEAEFSSYNLKNKKNIFIKEDFKLVPKINPEILEKETFLALNKVLLKLLQVCSNEKPDKIFFVLGAPWYISSGISIDLKRNKSFFVDREEIIRELESKSKDNNSNFTVIESRILSITANGYKINDLKGRKAKHVSASAILNISEKRFLKKIEAETIKYFPVAKMKIHTLPSISVDEISNIVNKNHFLIVFSEDEITEICFVKDKKVIESISVPFGRNYFLRVIIEIELARDLNSADSMLKMFNEGHLEGNKREVFEEIMREASSRCQKMLKTALFKYFNKDIHPESVAILSSSKEANSILKDIFSDYYMSNGREKDFIKLFISKDPKQSALFFSAVSSIKNLYF